MHLGIANKDSELLEGLLTRWNNEFQDRYLPNGAAVPIPGVGGLKRHLYMTKGSCLDIHGVWE